MRFNAALLFTSLLIVGAGCFQAPEPIVLPPQPERQSETLVGDVEVGTTDIKKDFVLNESAECRISIAYPTFPAASLPPLVSTQTEQAIAGFIAAALDHSNEVNSVSELDKIADDYLARCQQEIQAEYEDLSAGGEMLFTNLKRNIDIIYNVKLNEFHLLTVGLDQYAYIGGAHPNQDTLYLNIDRGGDQLLTLGDILNPEHLKAFLQYEKAQLLANNRDSLYPEIAEEYDALIEDKSVVTPEEQLLAYGEMTNFYLTPTALVTYYNSYEIAPYAAGPILVEIPLLTVKDYISSNGPLVPILENLLGQK